jgi:hypothetical protein
MHNVLTPSPTLSTSLLEHVSVKGRSLLQDPLFQFMNNLPKLKNLTLSNSGESFRSQDGRKGYDMQFDNPVTLTLDDCPRVNAKTSMYGIRTLYLTGKLTFTAATVLAEKLTNGISLQRLVWTPPQKESRTLTAASDLPAFLKELQPAKKRKPDEAGLSEQP